MPLAELVHDMVGRPPTVRVVAYDGSRAGDDGARATVVIRSPDALRRVVQRPGELGLARAIVAGDLDIEGDIEAVLALGFADEPLRLRPAALTGLVRAAGPEVLRPLPPPPEEVRLRGILHSRRRDAEAIAHHYDVSDEFYRLVLGPSMTYSCAVFDRPDGDLTAAQERKHELVCRKLGLRPGDRLLDVGCGWGSMLIHAARHHGVRGVGITISRRQAELAAKRVAEAGLADRVEIRLQDYRDLDDEPFDAVSSIGMLEHVGRARMPAYDRRVFDLLRPGGRFLNHGICRPGYAPPRTRRGEAVALARRLATAAGSSWTSRIDSALMQRYVFPDGELHELGTLVSLMAEAGFEVRHVEGLREHYVLTLRAWVRNLEQRWDEAVSMVGAGRARVWRLYMAASALGFDRASLQIHQILAVRPDRGRSGMPLRPRFEPD